MGKGLCDSVVFVVFFSGDITIPDGVTLTVDSDLNGASPQFTLTCISTGGPATTVTWTRDSEMLNGSTVLNDTVTAQYTHTLTVTGRLGGLYTCTVANDKPSEDSAQLNVQGLHTFNLPCSCRYYEKKYGIVVALLGSIGSLGTVYIMEIEI